MSSTHGTHDDANKAEIRRAIEDAEVQYRLKQFAEVVAQCELSLAIAFALGKETPEPE